MIKNHTNRAFDNDLRILRDRILLIAGRVEKMVANAIKSLSENDTALAQKTIDYDKSIDSDEVIVDRMSIELLAQRQPVGQDLRFIVSVIKMVTYFERLGDLAIKICHRIIELNRLDRSHDAGDIADMAKSVQAMIRETLEAFLERDYEKALSVIMKDDAVDELHHLITKRLIAEMHAHKELVENYYHLLSIAKWLERMGDHCTNLAEIIIYMIKGQDVRHKRLAPTE
ncbi:MAG TPA: phosphate signaling complex protein PhoU [Myxococcota bacterium]|nr:phosphate signaling complex protein PhoU [Myxococcota bacterium]